MFPSEKAKEKNSGNWGIKDFLSKIPAKKSKTSQIIDQGMLEEAVRKKLQEKKLISASESFNLLDLNLQFESPEKPELNPIFKPDEQAKLNKINEEFSENIKKEKIIENKYIQENIQLTENKFKNQQIITTQKIHIFKFENNIELLMLYGLDFLKKQFKIEKNEISSLFLSKILEDLYYLRESLKEESSKILENESIKELNSKLNERIFNQEQIIKRIEASYQEKIDELIEKNYVINQKIIEKENEYQLILKEKIEEIEELKKQINKLEIENYKIIQAKNQENIDKETMILELNNVQNELLNCKKIKKNEKFQAKPSLEGLFPSETIYEILKYLQPSDLISIRQTNKLAYHSMTFDWRFYKLIQTKIKENQIKEIKILKHELEYFHNLTAKIPDEHLKLSLIKYISLKEKLGDYIPKVLKQAQGLFQDDYLAEPKKNLLNKFFEKLHKPNNNFTKIEEINKTISKLLPNNHFEVDLTVLDHVEKEKTILLDETKLKSEEFFKKLLEKSIKLSSNQNKIGKFLEDVQRSFSELFVFTNVLLQEGKDLETLKNFLLSHILKINQENRLLKSQIEDLNEKLHSQKSMKEYLATKNKEFEIRLHEYDVKTVRNNEETMKFSDLYSIQLEKSNQLIQEKITSENKIKVLSKEVKQIRLKNQDQEKELKVVLDTCLDMKLLFEKLRLDL